MADVKKTVEIVFGAKDELSTKMSGMVGKFGDFSSTVAGGTKTILKFEAGVAAAGAAMAAAIVHSSSGQLGGRIKMLHLLDWTLYLLTEQRFMATT